MNNYVVDPDPYYTPRISIGPFNLKNEIEIEESIEYSLLQILGDNLAFTNSGKHAIKLALDTLQIQKSNVIGIVTTSGNAYVSKCVTETISEYCQWIMYDYHQEVDCLIIVHEFGFLLDLDSMNSLRRLKIPIINDFAYSFLSLYMSKRKDFRDEINLTSFPKSFSINFGGVIHLPSVEISLEKQNIEKTILEALKKQINKRAIEENISRRKRNRDFYKMNLLKYGYNVIWDKEEICPGVCMIAPSKPINLQLLKNFLQRNGIESSVFYGREAFFVPVHHFMSQQELEYVCYMIGAFKNDD